MLQDLAGASAVLALLGQRIGSGIEGWARQPAPSPASKLGRETDKDGRITEAELQVFAQRNDIAEDARTCACAPGVGKAVHFDGSHAARHRAADEAARIAYNKR